MENQNIIVSNGLSLSKLLTVAFIVLKLVGVISWSWVWVLAPFWIPYALFFGGLIIVLIVGSIISIFSNGY